MSIGENIKRFAGKSVLDFNPEKGIVNKDAVYRLRTGYDGPDFDEMWTAFIEHKNAKNVEELVIGMWGQESDDSSSGVIEKLVEAKGVLSNLKHLFLGDIVGEENEISWIQQSDVSPLLAAFPLLETLRVRGGNGLEIKKPVHDRLKKLIIETGGLDKGVVKQLAKAKFPALEHLELWLGTDEYGGNVEPKDLAPILGGELFPNLTYLGLCNSAIADKIAAAVADAPVLEKLETLDLSKGNLTDEGGAALMQFPLVSRLKKLDLRWHYLSAKCVKEMKEQGIKAVATERQESDDFGDGEVYRSIYCSE